MKRLLIGGRLDGQPEALGCLIEQCEHHQPDAACVGGLWAGSHSVDRRMSPRQRDFYRDFFLAIKPLRCPVFVLPGEHDVPLADFARLVMMAEVDNPHLHCVHATPYESAGFHLVGVGGDLNEVIDTWNDRLRSSRSAVEYYLRHLTRTPVDHTVVMLTTPPAGVLSMALGSDLAGDGRLASEVIHSVHPELVITFGETESRGVSRIASTCVVNPGRLSDGSAVLLDISRPDSARFLDAASAANAG
jgi:Icc-related predicted phosphoesterase